jgi:transcriptional regulator with XRE-family HTH domain
VTSAGKAVLPSRAAESSARRLAIELSQEALAAKSGLHRNFIGMIERGERNLTLLSLGAIAGVLRISIGELLTAAESRRIR